MSLSHKKISVLVILAIFGGITAFNARKASFLVKPYLQFGTKNSMAVLWETASPATTRVEYGESRLGDMEPNLSQSVELDGRRTMHEVVLEALQPETKYFWRVVSELDTGERLVSSPSTFRTSVKDSTAFSFLLYGDSQSNPVVWGKVAELGWKERPNFAVLAGDLVDRGGNLDDWLVEFFPPANVLMRRVPVYTVLGNHEDNHENYYKYMHNPAPEYYYTFTYGNAQLFMIDTNRSVEEGSEQYEWLETELAKSTATWKIAIHHHPPYSSEENDHGNSWTGSTSYGTHARNLVPLYEHYGVDFCLFGHVHMYERTWPLLQGSVNQKNGVIYINSGGAGGGLEDFAPTRSWFTAKVKSVHHYGYFAVHDNTVIFQAMDENGSMFDSFQLQKTGERLEQSHIMKPAPPRINSDGTLFTDTKTVKLSTPFEGVEIRYTLDGSAPSSRSTLYTAPLEIDRSAMLKVASFTEEGVRSRIMSKKYLKVEFQAAQKVGRLRPGLTYKYYEGDWSKLPDFSTLSPLRSGIAESIQVANYVDREDDVALVFEGYFEAPDDAIYTFYTESDDGSKLYVNDQQIVENDGLHGRQTRTGQVALAKGHHRVRIDFFDGGGDEFLSVSGVGEGFPTELLKSGSIFHK